MLTHYGSKEAVSATAVAVVLVVLVIVVGGGAYYVASLNTRAQTTTLTSTSISTSTTTSVSTSTATSTSISTSTSTSATTSVSTTTASFTLTVPVSLVAGGSTFVNPLMQSWITSFDKAHSQVSINYQPVGSGAGQQGVLSQTLDFAGSDATLSNAQLANYTGTLLQIPESLGGVALFYNVPELGNTSLRLTGSVIAYIYLQNITMWNDPAIVALNPGISLPAKAIIPVHRSDGSGTTYALSDYLSKVSPGWSLKEGRGTSLSWPANELAGKGSSGVAGLVKGNPYSIGYADSVYALSNKLTMAQIQNAAGNFVMPTIAGFQTAASTVPITSDTRISITNAPGANSYPISTYTWVLVWSAQKDYAKGYVITSFLWYMIHEGQQSAPALNYAPLPQAVVSVDEGLIKQLTYNGAPYLS